VRRALELRVDLSLTWSCYDPQPGSASDAAPRPCGVCDSCRLREKGFLYAGIEDPALRASS